jgi:undecaprenyl diphosphate synthase
MQAINPALAPQQPASENLVLEKVPKHIAIIMDGNGRWANKRGGVRIMGHKAGVDSVREVTETCAEVGVKYLTLYAFSTENWNRPKNEVNALMRLLIRALRNETARLNKNNIRLLAIGQIDRLPDDIRSELKEAIESTKNNDRMMLCLALSYSGRWDITEAMKKVAEKVKSGEIEPSDITDTLISSNLSTADIPDPDLIIRTSGEYRISNFLLWQLAYSELVITDTYWPDFRRSDIMQAIESYQKRERRFGKTSEQIQHSS